MLQMFKGIENMGAPEWFVVVLSLIGWGVVLFFVFKIAQKIGLAIKERYDANAWKRKVDKAMKDGRKS